MAAWERGGLQQAHRLPGDDTAAKASRNSAMNDRAPALARDERHDATTDPAASRHGWRHWLFGERSLTKVAALVADAGAAEAAAEALRHDAGFDRSQVRTLRPEDASTSHRELRARKLEPEQRGIAHTLMRTHVTLGIAGLVVGIVLFVLLRASGVPQIVASPWASGLVIVAFGAVFGMMAGGLVSLRPDHAMLFDELRRGLEQGRFAVVAHPLNRAQADAAQHCLTARGLEVMRSL